MHRLKFQMAPKPIRLKNTKYRWVQVILFIIILWILPVWLLHSKENSEKAYELLIEAEGKSYTASTTIPELTKTIEELSFEENIDRDDSSKVILYGQFTDPPGFGNYIRYFTNTKRWRFFPGFKFGIRRPGDRRKNIPGAN